MMLPFKLRFWDQFTNEISINSKLSVDRSTTPRPRLVRPRSGLFDPEGIPEMREPFGSEDPGVAEAVRSTIAKGQANEEIESA